MNEIVIDIDKFSDPVREELKARAVRERKPLKHLMAEMVAEATETIIAVANHNPNGKEAA